MSESNRAPDAGSPDQNPEKDPADWVTGEEPMTGPQRSYLETLSREAGAPFDDTLTKADASRRIDELQERTGRGRGGGEAGGAASGSGSRGGQG